MKSFRCTSQGNSIVDRRLFGALYTIGSCALSMLLCLMAKLVASESVGHTSGRVRICGSMLKLRPGEMHQQHRYGMLNAALMCDV